MTKQTTFPTPANDALAAQGPMLQSAMDNQLAGQREWYGLGKKESLIATYEERKALGGKFWGTVPKPSDSKAKWVEFLAQSDVKNSDAYANLHRLQGRATVEDEVIRRATNAETWEQVMESRKAAYAQTLEEGRYDSSDHLANLAYEYEARFQIASRWMQVRTAMTDHEMAPIDALKAVVVDVEASIVQRAMHGGFRSSSMTSNLREEAITRGLAKFLEDLKWTLANIERY